MSAYNMLSEHNILFSQGRRSLLPFALMLSLSCIVGQPAHAQYRPRGDHSFKNTREPAGTIGKLTLMQQPALNGVMQPVLVKVPKGASVSIAEGAGFSYDDVDATLVSLQVGSTYRLKVGNIPNQYGTVYPTIELIGRLHPPPGKELRYPIPIQFTKEELTMALRGKFVTRVIYVEDPKRALAVRDMPDNQRYFEVMAHEDPFRVANRLGRPVAILRMGSLAPASTGPTAEFLFSSPPIQRHAMLAQQVPYVPSKLDPSDMPAEPIKRDELPDAPEQPEGQEPPLNIGTDVPDKKELPEEPAAESDPFAEDEFGAEPDEAEDPAVDEFDAEPATNSEDPLEEMPEEEADPFGEEADPLGEEDDPLGEDGDLFEELEAAAKDKTESEDDDVIVL